MTLGRMFAADGFRRGFSLLARNQKNISRQRTNGPQRPRVVPVV